MSAELVFTCSSTMADLQSPERYACGSMGNAESHPVTERLPARQARRRMEHREGDIHRPTLGTPSGKFTSSSGMISIFMFAGCYPRGRILKVGCIFRSCRG